MKIGHQNRVLLVSRVVLAFPLLGTSMGNKVILIDSTAEQSNNGI